MSEEDPGAEMYALHQRHKPKTAADWRRIARIVIAEGGMKHPSPLFAAQLAAEADKR